MRLVEGVLVEVLTEAGLELPFVRFRKGLDSSPANGTWRNLKAASEAQQQTVPVVDAAHIASTLDPLPPD